MKRVHALAVVACALAVFLAHRAGATERMTPDAAPAIVNGTFVDPASYPYYAWFPNKGGGALVAPDMILTAAHINVRVGDFVEIGGAPGRGGEGRTVASVVRHDAAFDLMLVRLRTPSTKKPIRYATARPPAKRILRIMGRGKKNGMPTGGNPDPRFSIAHVTSLTPDEAARRIAAEPGFSKELKAAAVGAARTKVVFTTVSGSKTTCTYDSGGPVVLPKGPGQPEDLLLGILSGGPPGCGVLPSKALYSFFTSVPDWLRLRGLAVPLANRMVTCEQRNGGYHARYKSGAKWVCPKHAPWDAGVWAAFGEPDLPDGSKPCARTKACADSLHAFHALIGAPTAPARYVPG